MTVKSSILTAAFASVLLAGCAAPVVHNTASGKVEEIFTGTPGQTKPKIVGMMANFGFNVSKDTPYLIAFDKPTENVMAAVLLGSKYDSTPNTRITYTFVQMGPNTRVIADASIITNPGSAFERVTNMNGNQDTVKLQTWLDNLAAQR
jgi:hypothetical protein